MSRWALEAVDEHHRQQLSLLLTHGNWPPVPERVLRDGAKLGAMICRQAGASWFVKRYSYSGLRRLAARLGRERARRNYVISMAWQAAGIPVPQPLACLVAPGTATSWFVCEALDGAIDMHELTRHGQPEADAVQRQILFTGLQLLARVHQAGWSHGDAKWANFILSADYQQIWLVDLDAARRCKLGSRRQARDLARFCLNAREAGFDTGLIQQALQDYLSRTGSDSDRFLAWVDHYHDKVMRRHQTSSGD